MMKRSNFCLAMHLVDRETDETQQFLPCGACRGLWKWWNVVCRPRGRPAVFCRLLSKFSMDLKNSKTYRICRNCPFFSYSPWPPGGTRNCDKNDCGIFVFGGVDSFFIQYAVSSQRIWKIQRPTESVENSLSSHVDLGYQGHPERVGKNDWKMIVFAVFYPKIFSKRKFCPFGFS